jgi:hypothetical protein
VHGWKPRDDPDDPRYEVRGTQTHDHHHRRAALVRLHRNCETCCNQAVLKGKPGVVFLRVVLTIEESGRALLARLATKGFCLRAAGVYTSHVAQDFVAANSSVPGSPSA